MATHQQKRSKQRDKEVEEDREKETHHPKRADSEKTATIHPSQLSAMWNDMQGYRGSESTQKTQTQSNTRCDSTP
eukprot:646991-Prorocentrum_lima.AAC.1